MAQQQETKKDKDWLLTRMMELRLKFPEVNYFKVHYHGEGDSFDSFDDWEAYGAEDKYINDDALYSRLADYIQKDQANYDNSLLWEAIEHSQADFNDDGSFGYVIFNLQTMDVSVDNYFRIVTETNEGGIESLNERLQ